MEIDKLLEIEKGFWSEGAEYYNKHISDDAMFVFPNMVLGKEDGVSSADKAPRWDSLDITEEKVINLSKEIAILTYKVKASRDSSDDTYSGSITTIYRLEDADPKMTFHQHTPDTK